MLRVSETLRGYWKAFRRCDHCRRVVEQTHPPQFQCELLEPRLLLSAVSGVDDKFTLSLVNTLQEELIRPVIVVDADQSQDDQTQQQELVEPLQIDLDSSPDTVPQPVFYISLDSDGLEEAVTNEADQDLPPDDGLIGENTEVTDTKTSAYGLDITLQSFQLSVVENYTYPENITSDSEELSSNITVSDGYDDTTDQLTETLLAANPPPISAEPATQTTLTNDWLIPFVQEAINRWSATTAVADSQVSLDNVQFQIVDLPTGILAQVTGEVISIDLTASGFGWFIDSTPADDFEFSMQTSDSQLTASQESAAYGRIDLLTVVSHELGHVLGLEDIDPLADADSLMTTTLGPGVRRLPSQENLSSQESGPISNAYVIVDLVTTIDSYLTSNESGSVIVAEAKLGGFLDLFTLTLDFSGIVYSAGSYDSGLVDITTQTGELFPGQSAFVLITDGDSDGISISGTHNPGTGQFGLTLEQFELNIPSVLTASAENVTIEYNPAGASNQKLVKIGSFEMVLLVLDNTTAQVNNLIIRQDGFSVENASVSVAAATWLNTLELSNFDLIFTDVNFSTTGPALSGTIDVSATTIKLFPSQDFFTTEITTFSGSYNLGTSALSLSATNLKIAFSDVLLLELGTASFSMDAGAGTFSASVASGMLSSPRFTDLPSISVTNLVINQAGLSFDNVTLSPTDINIASLLTVSQLGMQVDGFSYDVSSGDITGTVSFSATNIILFAGVDIFDTKVTGFNGSYNLETTALTLGASSLNMGFGSSGNEILLLAATGISFSLDQRNGTFSFSANTVTISSPQFADLPNIAVAGLVINQDQVSFDTATLGPINFEIGSVLTIVDFEIVVTNFNYSTSGGLVSGTVGFAFVSVGIFPGQSLFTAQIDNFSGSYDIISKALNVRADNVMIQISDLLKVTATDVDININPFSMSFGSIEVTSPNFPKISGTLTELEITETGFSLGSAILSYGGDISIGPLTVNGLAIGIMNYEYSSVAPEPFSGSILFYSGGASLIMGGSFSTVISDTDADGRAISAMLNFEAGVFKDLQFMVDKLEVKVGTFLVFTTTGVDIDTGAVDDEFVIKFTSISALVKVGSLSLKGTAKNFGVTASGKLAAVPGETFGVILEIGGADGSAFQWPSWLPIKINTLGIELDFAKIAVNPLDFTFILSASVSDLPAVAGLEFSGTVEGIRIRPALLLEGKFPVVDIASIGVSVSGALFGGEINAGLIGGILKIAETSPGNYEVIDPTDTNTEVHDRVLFMGIQGGFSMPGLGGLTIRFALSELGPLGVFLNIEVPGGIVLEPHIGLAVNDFAAGVEFFKSLPSIDDPLQLRDPAFSVSSTVSADTWLAGVKGQVFDQYVAMKSNPSLPGFLAAFTSPMLIKGSAKIYTIYTSQQVFNGQVDLILSTDGKFLISGKLNFAADNITISGKLYANLSNVFNGDVTVLFLADIPEQARLLSIDGKLKMGFRDETGQEVEIPVVISDPVDTNAETTADLVFPGNGETIDVGVINSNFSDGNYYIDVKFQPGANQTLDYESIFDATNEFYAYLYKLDGTSVSVSVDDPLPIETSVIGGISVDTILTAGTLDELISLAESRSVQRFRYLITDPGFKWEPGEVEVMFFVGDGEDETFTILGPTADISNPSNGGRIEISEFDGRMYLDVTFVPTRTGGAIISGAPVDIPVLSGPGLSSVSIIGVPTSVEVPVRFPDGSVTLRYELSGQFATGEVTLAFEADTFQDSEGFGNTAQILSFVIDGATADLSSPGNGNSIGINVLENQGYIDVIFTSAWDVDIDFGTLNDGAPEIEITLSDGTKLAITDDPTGSYELDGKTVYSYSFTGTLIPGTATVIFLDESFTDMSGLANIEEVETFFIDQPTVTFSNLADGATYLTTSFNELEAGKQVGIYEESATERYFELTLIPTYGAEINVSTIQITDLQIASLSEISIDRFERVIEQIEDDEGNLVDSPTNRFRFFFSGSFPDQAPTEVTFSMAAGAWQDMAENESGEMSVTITVRKPALTLYLELEGGITLDAAGFLEDPIFDVRGYVNFEAKLTPDGPRFELEFGGTGKVVYLGNLGSMAGLFIMEIPEKFILDSHDDPDKDADALTAGDLLTDLGVTLEQDHFLNLIQLPKLWGVIKLETNFEVLKEIGIDLKAEALLEINITAEVKVETITLEGIPGDSFAQLAASDTLIDELNSDSLPDELSALFTGENELDSTYEVRTVIGGVLWRIIDSVNEKQYFIQVQDETPLPTQANPDPQSQLKLLLRNETQEFILQSKVLQVQAYGQAIFRFPAYVNPEKTEMGPEWFRLTGAFSLKLSISSLEVFQNGQLTLSPAGQKILDIRSMAVLIVKANPIGLAGKIKLGANIELPGVLLSGNLEAYVNTFGTDQVFEVPGFLQPIVGFETVTIYGVSPILNPNYDPADADSPILVPDNDPGATGGAYLTVAARADLHLLGDAVMLRGAFRLSATTDILEVRAKVTTAITVPGLADPLFDLNGSAAFALDIDGLYGRADLYLNSTLPPPTFAPGFDFNAEFVLEFNTASVAKQIQTYEFDKTNGNKLELVAATLPALKLQLIAGGTLAFTTTTDPEAFVLAGQFEFLMTPSLIEIQAEVSVSSLLVNGNAAGVFKLNSLGLAGFIQVNVAAGDMIGNTGLTEITGIDFRMSLELAFYINTGHTDVVLNGVTLAHEEVKLEASGFLELSIGGAAGFRIEGSLLVQANNEGFAVEVHGILSAELLDINLVRMNVDGGLVITDSPSGYFIAGRLDLSAGAGAMLYGNGFTFDAVMSLEVNTSGLWVDLNGNGLDDAGDLEAGFYARIHADGDLSLQAGGNTGFKLDGLFDLEVGLNGLMVAAEADFLAQVAGQTILKLHADSELLINHLGIAAHIELSVDANASTDGTGFSLNGLFIFELNTTSQAITHIGGVYVGLAAGPYIRLSVTDDGGESAYIQLSIGGASLNCFRLEGGFTIEVGSGGLQIAADGVLKAIVGGTELLSIDAEGALLINQYGIAAKISLDASAGVSGIGFMFTGSFILEVNTTNRFISSIAGQHVNLAAGPYIRIDIAGSLEMLQLMTVNGAFELEVGTAGLNVDVDAKLSIFSVSFDVDAILVINSSGMKFRTQLSLATASSFIPFDNFKISGTLMLEVNTTSSPKYVGSVLIPKQTARVSVLKGELNILGLKATGSIIISVGAGGFEFIIPNNDPLTLKVGTIITAELFGHINSSGFSFTATADFYTTTGPAYLDAEAEIRLSNSEFYFHIEGNAGLKIAGINIGVSASGTVQILGTKLSLSVRGCVNVLVGKICATVTFSIGTISPPGAAQVTPEPVLATRLSNGTLRLNIGSFASVRGAGYSEIEDETFYVTHGSGTASSETVIVSAFGFSQTYPNIKSILVSDAASGNDFVQIGENILVNAVMNGGDSDDSLIYLGSGTATINGGAGDDFIQVAKGNSHVLNGSTGNDRLVGGSGRDTLNGGSGDDTLGGGGGNDILNGGTGIDTIYGNQGDDIITGGSGNDEIFAGDGNDTIYGGPGNDSINGDAGEDYIEGNEGSDTIHGDSGLDVIYGHTGNDIIYGDEDRDLIYGNSGNDELHGGTGNDDIYGSTGDDTIYGDSGDDLIYGGNGSDRIYGGENNDTIYGGNDSDIIFGGAHNDHIYGQDGDDILLGDDGDAQLQAFAIDSNVESDDGNDYIYGEAGEDIIIGGGGNDTIVGDDAEDGTPNDNYGSDILIGDGGSVIYTGGMVSNISTMDSGQGGTDNIEGNEGDDVGIGGNAGDNIYGHTGEDILLGDNGSISFVSGQLQAINTTGQSSGGADYIEGNENNDIIIGGVNGSSDTLYGNNGDEDVIAGGSGQDIIIGDIGYVDYDTGDGDLLSLDIITTTDPTVGGKDDINGGSGNDIIFGGTGDDTIHAGSGNDLVFGDHGKVEAITGHSIDATQLPLATLNPGFTFTSIDTQNINGGDDLIFGDAGKDIILGQQGSDRLYGGDDDDDIIGGHNIPGAPDSIDRIDGGAGNDVIAGDNASILRRGDTLSPRIRVLSGDTIYGEGLDNDGEPLVTDYSQLNPTGVAERNILIYDHSDGASANTYGNDYIAGGADDDVIFGQMGNDTIQGDGSVLLIPDSAADVTADRSQDGLLVVIASFEAAGDGDDYIEGNSGDDVIFGNLGQDDIIGGSSSLFSLINPDQRHDGSDLIFGGAGNRVDRNHLLTDDDNDIIVLEERHARDADMILGDNGNVFRLIDPVTGQYLAFNYDIYSEILSIIPRAARLLDYTPGGSDYDAVGAAFDIGSDDEIHGESGDDFIYGMCGSDVLFGDSQDDDIIGGYGNDWISGGTGDDGVIGDDGRIYISRNGTEGEPLYGIEAVEESVISTQGKAQSAIINVTGQLKKTVNLTPFDVAPGQEPLYADDIIYGGWGNDFLHGGSGDDAISGAEALASFYDAPSNLGNKLNYDPDTTKFEQYDAEYPRTRISADGVDFLLNFEAFTDGENQAATWIDDGDDVIFGDLGNDWLVGGTGQDHLYGGYGNDLLNVDDNLDTNNDGLNNSSDYGDFAGADTAYGGAGRDVLIANSEDDRLIDWMGEFNSYIIPFAAFGKFTISRRPQPRLMQYLYDLSKADGADQTLGLDTDPSRSRNGEPFGELGLVNQKDRGWSSQKGSPRDPQAGNTPGKKK